MFPQSETVACEPEELFETISQALLSSVTVDRDCLSGWGGHHSMSFSMGFHLLYRKLLRRAVVEVGHGGNIVLLCSLILLSVIQVGNLPMHLPHTLQNYMGMFRYLFLCDRLLLHVFMFQA
ncbi:unnamed protein product [Fraxinus pennsylvanica]|uniref:Uncharacterized protein n=1 Tax=Fraxinus pennsylvanica TaxID=56036 RepID=A0AAD1Z9U3_9LAMI|nr:unnamed protein product [Fraxinus pennsylvanica]